jgi:aspartyl aminopeptidase
VYGGALVNSWLDRDLGVAGRAVLHTGEVVLVNLREPVARVPQLAIHLDREVNERGLLLDRQVHLSPIWGLAPALPGAFLDRIASAAAIAVENVSVWDLMLFDLTPAGTLGVAGDLLASGRLDNLVSCWAAVRALIAADSRDLSPAASPPGSAAGPSERSSTASGTTAVVSLFDHEEVGSQSTTGASGPLLEQTLERLSLASQLSRAEHLEALSRSMCLSADNAHAVHPNYPDRHEPDHRPLPNKGPVLKVNANQRYATSARSAAHFLRCCEVAGIPAQVFVSRNNMPCGSTIGPLTATRLGIDTVDVGVAQLSMHSARELCGADDPGMLAEVLAVHLTGQ